MQTNWLPSSIVGVSVNISFQIEFLICVVEHPPIAIQTVLPINDKYLIYDMTRCLIFIENESTTYYKIST